MVAQKLINIDLLITCTPDNKINKASQFIIDKTFNTISSINHMKTQQNT